MNAIISHSVLNSSAFEKYRDMKYSSSIEIPIELRLALVGEVVENLKKSFFAFEKEFAYGLQVTHFTQLIKAIDDMRAQITIYGDEIDRIAEKSRETYAGALIQLLPAMYAIGDLQVKLLLLNDLSGALGRKESLYIEQSTTVSAPVNEVVLTVGNQVGEVLGTIDLSSLQEPELVEYSSLDTLSIEEMLQFDNVTFRMLLERALDEMDSLYTSQITENMEDSFGSSVTAIFPTTIIEQISFWMGVIHSFGPHMEFGRIRELKIFLAFNQLGSIARDEIVRAMTPSEPFFEDFGRVDDPRQETLF